MKKPLSIKHASEIVDMILSNTDDSVPEQSEELRFPDPLKAWTVEAGLLRNHPIADEITTTLRYFVSLEPFGPADGVLAGRWDRLCPHKDMDLFLRPRSSSAPLDVDTLAATILVPGVTAREICRHFWDVSRRLRVDHTVAEPPTILARPDDATTVQHQLHKRVWPAAQRDAVFWSHLRAAGRRCIVVNRSTEHLAPEVGSRVRASICVALLCEDVSPVRPGNSRTELQCRLRYSAQVAPGGKVSAAVLRPFQKRELPVFVRQLTAFVRQSTDGVEVTD